MVLEISFLLHPSFLISWNSTSIFLFHSQGHSYISTLLYFIVRAFTENSPNTHK
jgi:hypothetical protein